MEGGRWFQPGSPPSGRNCPTPMPPPPVSRRPGPKPCRNKAKSVLVEVQVDVQDRGRKDVLTLAAGLNPFQFMEEMEETALQGHLMTKQAFLLVIIPRSIHPAMVFLLPQLEGIGI